MAQPDVPADPPVPESGKKTITFFPEAFTSWISSSSGSVESEIGGGCIGLNFNNVRCELLGHIERLTRAHEGEVIALRGRIEELQARLHIETEGEGSGLPARPAGASRPGGPLQTPIVGGLAKVAADEQSCPELPPGEEEEASAGPHKFQLQQVRFDEGESEGIPKRGFVPFTSSLSSIGSSGKGSDQREECCTMGALRRSCQESLRIWKEVLAYRFESLMIARGFCVQMIGLIIMGLISVGFGGAVYSQFWTFDHLSDPREEQAINRLSEGFWEAWVFMADPGTHAKVFNPEQRFVGALIAVFGIFYFAVILGVIIEYVQAKMASLKQGRSSVVERNHIIVLGWTDKVIPLLRELCANRMYHHVIVVLADEPVSTMDVDLSLQLPESKRHGTKIVCRSGSPLLVSDLLKVSAENAKAIIVLSSGADADLADSQTLRSVLSLKCLGRELRGHIVAEVRDIDNEPLLQLVGGGSCETLVSHDMIGLLMVMAARHPGLAKVYESLLGYDGMEFYIQRWPEVIGLAFEDLAERFPKAVPIGIRTITGEMVINPPRDLQIGDYDAIVVLAEEADSYSPQEPISFFVGKMPERKRKPRLTEKILICGWRRDIRDVLHHLDKVVQRQTEVHLITHFVPIEARIQQLTMEGLDVSALTNIRLVHHFGNTSVRRTMEELPIPSFTSIIIFAEQAFELDVMHADSHALATLLLIRDLQTDIPRKHAAQITCEMLDSRTRSVIGRHSIVRYASDFIQSNRLVAQLLAMIGDQRGVKCIFDELLGAKGCKVVIEPARDYVHCDERICFWELTRRVATNKAILIGFIDTEDDRRLILNPDAKAQKRFWNEFDLILICDEFGKPKVSGELSNNSFTSIEYEDPQEKQLISCFKKDRGLLHKPSRTLGFVT